LIFELNDEDNIALLSDAVGLDISVNESESSVGDFSVDIFATETGTDRKIIIENQLEDTNHDHLGKLITYASGKSADVIIWVVKFLILACTIYILAPSRSSGDPYIGIPIYTCDISKEEEDS
jgi:hypothetical protein